MLLINDETIDVVVAIFPDLESLSTFSYWIIIIETTGKDILKKLSSRLLLLDLNIPESGHYNPTILPSCHFDRLVDEMHEANLQNYLDSYKYRYFNDGRRMQMREYYQGSFLKGLGSGKGQDDSESS